MNEQRVADALQDCLEQIEAGRSPDEALARYSALRASLLPQLQAALTARAHRPGPAPVWSPAMRSRLAEVDAANDRSSARLALARWQAPLMRAAAVILAIGLALGTASYAAASRLPADHWLQPMVQRIERVREIVVDAVVEVLPGIDGPKTDEGLDDRGPAEARIEPPPSEVGSSRVEPAPELDAKAEDAPRDGEPRASALRTDAPETPAAPASRLTLAGTPGLAAVIPPSSPIAPLPSPTPTSPPAAQAPATSLPPTQRPTEAFVAPQPTDLPEPSETPEPAPTDLPPATATDLPSKPVETPPGPPPPVSTPVAPDARASIEGTIVKKWDDGKPVRGFELDIHVFDRCPRPRETRPVAMVKSDREGRFRVEDLAPGSYYVAVLQFSRGGPSYMWHPSARSCPADDAITLSPGERRRGVDISLRDPREGQPGGGDGQPGPPRDPGGRGGEPTVEPTLEPAPEPTLDLLGGEG